MLFACKLRFLYNAVLLEEGIYTCECVHTLFSSCCCNFFLFLSSQFKYNVLFEVMGATWIRYLVTVFVRSTAGFVLRLNRAFIHFLAYKCRCTRKGPKIRYKDVQKLEIKPKHPYCQEKMILWVIQKFYLVCLFWVCKCVWCVFMTFYDLQSVL